MKKTSAKRLHLTRETVLSLTELSVAVGGGISVPTKPNASCFKVCRYTDGCPPTRDNCELLSENC